MLTLNTAQQAAVNAIQAQLGQFGVMMLNGITGSGKTEVYMRAMQAVLAFNQQVLVLVPEINLTPQTIQQFQDRFAEPIAVQHSNLSPRARLLMWQQVRAGAVRILIGTRSAIFASFKQLGLIIVDEEHDVSYKQQERFRYHARDLAVVRAQLNQIPVVLGSATPSLETLANVERKRYQSLFLTERAGQASLPTFHLVNLIKEKNVQAGLSAPLLAAMQQQLSAGKQVMLFLNRRGFAPTLYCPHCTRTVDCAHCDMRMVYHQKPPRLHCHHCESVMLVPQVCPHCREEGLLPIGLGTQRIESALQSQFENMPIIRMDRDSTKNKGSLEALLQQINEQTPAILLGTQMLAKGHHFPRVTLVGIVDADSGLFSADFRGSEQMGQLLLQVAGRAGRALDAGQVWVQTRHPTHPLLQQLLTQGYGPFAETLLAERKIVALPPYHFMATLRAHAKEEPIADSFLKQARAAIEKRFPAVHLIGPLATLFPKRKGLHAKQLIFKSASRVPLHNCLKAVEDYLASMKVAKRVKWVLDIDPVEV